MLSPCLFNLYAEYIMQNAGLEEAQVEVKIARRNSNNLRYARDTILMEESEEELKGLLKEQSEKVALKLNIQKTKIMGSSPITSWQRDGGTKETVTDFIFLGSKITAAMKLKDACSLKHYDKTRWCIKKQRRYFADKSTSSQSYGFSSGHVWMSGLGHKKG